LAEQPTRQEIAQRESTRTPTPDQATIKGKLVDFTRWALKQGYTIDVAKTRTRWLKRLITLGADLWNPESVKETISKQEKWTNGFKMLNVYAYEMFMTMESLTWTRPRYQQEEKLPFIPTEEEIDQLIAACGKKLGAFLLALKETGADPGEMAKTQWVDINIEARSINIKPVKGHRPRIMPISQQLIDRLTYLPKKSERIFNLGVLSRCYYPTRKRIAAKLGNPRINSISFTTLRHWKGTMEYHRTRDILHVQKILGHKRIENTLKYINLETQIFQTHCDQFWVKVAQSVDEACPLVESGFEYVTGNYSDGGKIFRKRK